MRFPKSLNKGDLIGITAPSNGVEGIFLQRLDNAISQLNSMGYECIYRTIWQMKMNGWFRNCNGILFGRPDGYSDVKDFSFTDALSLPLGDLNIPIIYDADIGHLPPQLTLINGAYAAVEYCNGAGEIIQSLG